MSINKENKYEIFYQYEYEDDIPKKGIKFNYNNIFKAIFTVPKYSGLTPKKIPSDLIKAKELLCKYSNVNLLLPLENCDSETECSLGILWWKMLTKPQGGTYDDDDGKIELIC